MLIVDLEKKEKNEKKINEKKKENRKKKQVSKTILKTMIIGYH